MRESRLKKIRDLVAERGLKHILKDSRNSSDIVIIGENCNIKEGAVIGTDGFGYERNEVNELEKFPHYGKVIIGKNVDIGANTCIDRGNLEDTIIGDGTKIDNLVHVGHNCKVGKNVIIVAGTVLGGHTVIEDNCIIYANVMTKPWTRIGSGSVIGANSFVNKDVPVNEIWAGVPAKKIKDKDF